MQLADEIVTKLISTCWKQQIHLRQYFQYCEWWCALVRARRYEIMRNFNCLWHFDTTGGNRTARAPSSLPHSTDDLKVECTARIARLKSFVMRFPFGQNVIRACPTPFPRPPNWLRNDRWCVRCVYVSSVPWPLRHSRMHIRITWFNWIIDRMQNMIWFNWICLPDGMNKRLNGWMVGWNPSNGQSAFVCVDRMGLIGPQRKLEHAISQVCPTHGTRLSIPDPIPVSRHQTPSAKTPTKLSTNIMQWLSAVFRLDIHTVCCGLRYWTPAKRIFRKLTVNNGHFSTTFNSKL